MESPDWVAGYQAAMKSVDSILLAALDQLDMVDKADVQVSTEVFQDRKSLIKAIRLALQKLC